MPDIKVVALTHMLEVQENGRDHIRKEPIKVCSLVAVEFLIVQ